MNKNAHFLLASVAFTVTLALVSCSNLRASAADISASEQAGIYDYLNTGQSGLADIDFRLDEDEDGNRSVRLKILGMQSLIFHEAFGAYDNMDFSVAPGTVTFSGGGISALYKDSSNNIKPVLLHLTDFTSSYGRHYLVTAPDFSFYFDSSGEQSSQYRFRYYSTSGSLQYYSFEFGDIYQGQFSTFINPNLDAASISDTYYSPASLSTMFMVYSSSIPTISSFTRFTGGQVVGGLGQYISLPSGTVDTSKPWEYYNDVFLPYVNNQYGDQYNSYLVFPDGYTPPAPAPSVPVEYPTLPGFDYALETNGTEPSTDFNYNIPDLPGKDIAVPSFDFTQINPAEIMAPVANGLTGLWSLITGVLTEYNLFPYVAIAVLAAIVAGLMHLGK